jgi:hypothetical protein
MTFEQRAELIADFVEVVSNKYRQLCDDKRLAEAIKAYNDTYNERRVHGFSKAQREAYIAGIVELLGRQTGQV